MALYKSVYYYYYYYYYHRRGILAGAYCLATTGVVICLCCVACWCECRPGGSKPVHLQSAWRVPRHRCSSDIRTVRHRCFCKSIHWQVVRTEQVLWWAALGSHQFVLFSNFSNANVLFIYLEVWRCCNKPQRSNSSVFSLPNPNALVAISKDMENFPPSASFAV